MILDSRDASSPHPCSSRGTSVIYLYRFPYRSQKMYHGLEIMQNIRQSLQELKDTNEYAIIVFAYECMATRDQVYKCFVGMK